MAEAPDSAQRERALDPAALLHRPGAGGLREDGAPDPALPRAPRARRAARGDRRDHVHAQGRRGDAQARLRARSPAHASRAAREEHAARTWDLARAALDANDRLGWKLEENAARLRVQTIDALCVSLTRRMPIVSRLGAQPETIDDASRSYDEAARNLLPPWRFPTTRAEDVARLLAHLDNDVADAIELIVGHAREPRALDARVVRTRNDRAALEAALVQVRAAARRAMPRALSGGAERRRSHGRFRQEPAHERAHVAQARHRSPRS
jgi:hypothetical protein